MTNKSAKTIVLYIAGLGRSGSTVIGQALNTSPEVTYVGELHNLWTRGWEANWLCENGETFRESKFWQSALGFYFEEVNSSPQQSSHNVHVVKSLRHRLAWMPWTQRKDEIEEYRRNFESLYDSIALAERNELNVIVDGGKMPYHALVMSKSDKVDFKVLHLVRDPRAVAYSRIKKKQNLNEANGYQTMRTYPTGTTAARWVVHNVNLKLHFSGSNNYKTLRYEDFASEPYSAICSVVEDLELPLSIAPFDNLKRKIITRRYSPSFSGNPDRLKKGDIQIRTDDDWETALTGPQRLLPTLANWVFNRW